MTLSIRTVLLVALVGLQLFAAAIVLSSSYLSSERAVLGQAKALVLRTTDETIRQTRDFLQPARAAVELSKQLKEGGLFKSTKDRALEKYFFEQLRTSPQISGLFYGDIAGNALFVSRSSEVAGADYRTKITTRENQQVGTKLIYRDEGFHHVKLPISVEDSYDPRERVWYKQVVATGGTIWTDPYIFYSSQQPGITVAAPVFDRFGALEGVMGVDIEISAISNFLSDLNLGPSGAAIVLGANGDVIAHPNPEQIRKLEMSEGSGFRLAKISEIDDLVARSAVGALEAIGGHVDFSVKQSARFDVGEQTYDVAFSPIMIGPLKWTLAVYVSERDFLGEILQNRKQTISIIAIITLLTVLGGWLIARSITQRLTILSDCANQIAQGGNPDTRALPRNFVELENVSTAFKRMTTWLDDHRTQNKKMNDKLLVWSWQLEVRVEERTKALQQGNELLRSEIAERIAAERQLALEIERHHETANDLKWALADAHDASQAKTRFLSSMSHELRTPLNAIIGFAQMLAGHAGPLNSRQRDEYAGHILTSGERLLHLVNQVLDLAAIEAGKTTLKIEQVDPKKIIRQVIEELNVIARDRAVTLVDETDGEAIGHVSADTARMTQTLVNLVANAIKYNHVGGEVRISSRINKNRTRISVTDNGIGIPKNRRSEVFQSFNRLGNEHKGLEGSGVGLSLSKEFIESMDGRIGFDSVEGKGSTFWFELPIAREQTKSAADRIEPRAPVRR